jgi:hypothetical protein
MSNEEKIRCYNATLNGILTGKYSCICMGLVIESNIYYSSRESEFPELSSHKPPDKQSGEMWWDRGDKMSRYYVCKKIIKQLENERDNKTGA